MPMRMEKEFIQKGGIRYGSSVWSTVNFTAPFACLRVSKNVIILSVAIFRLWQRTFTFQRSDIRQLRWKRGLFSHGLQIEHTVSEYPPLVLFWAVDRKTLTENLREFGYQISDYSRAA